MKTRVNKHVLMFSNKKTTSKHGALMYFLQLVLTFTPHYIIMVKGLLKVHSYMEHVEHVFTAQIDDLGSHGQIIM